MLARNDQSLEDLDSFLVAFGLAAASIFPALMMGIFGKKIGSTAAISGMVAGIGVTMLYVFQHKGIMFIPGTSFLGDMGANWFFGDEAPGYGHSYLYTEELLRRMVEGAGFEVVAFEEPTSYVTEPGLRLVCRSTGSACSASRR